MQFYFSGFLNLLAFAEGFANSLCLLRAYMLYKARMDSGYAVLDEEKVSDARTVVDVNPKASPPKVEKNYAPLSYP